MGNISPGILVHDMIQRKTYYFPHCYTFIKCLSYFSLPFVHGGGGFHLDPFIFEYFSVGIATYLHTPKQLYICKKNNPKCFISKWRPRNEISFFEKSHVTKILKVTFPKELFFNEIWLKVEEQEYIYIFKIKLKKKNTILFKNNGLNKFCDIA